MKYSDALLDYGFYLLNVDSITAAVQVYQVVKYSDALLDYGFYLLNVDSITAAVQVYQVGEIL